MIELTLPYCPSINQYKSIGRLKTTKSGKIYQERYNSPETMQFYCQVINICRRQGVKSLGGATISLEVDIHPPSKRKADISNRIKVLEDSLVKAGCFDDDSQIALLTVRRCSIIEHGQIIVRISPYEPPRTERSST
jgi:crossover junction endodeoxyribonuclease RusA